ncbi:glycogen/starch synthase [Candidatus Woesearchaeota archaeon]|nr:glycogen/starch synthase [Candidatus Woesearchaeota archaeon]
MKPDTVFEVSWEVCNKVGGIYTVLESKAGLMQDNYANYILIGPYFADKAKFDFAEENAPKEFQEIFKQLEQEGIQLHYGAWQIKSSPKCILLEIKDFSKQTNFWKGQYWDLFRIDSLYSTWEFEEPMLWATAAGKLLEAFQQTTKKKTLAHCHEWLAGFALLYLKKQQAKVATVFTTHATMLGRVLSSEGFELYTHLDSLNADEEARKRSIIDKHSTEKACALNADIFTTVSEITGLEAEKLLGRKPDVLVLNGLDIEKFPSFEETSVQHQTNREIIREFIAYYFFPYYYFDLEETLTFFIVGRYEFKNKGIDIFIKALSQLNERLIQEKSKKTIVVFFWIPRDIQGAKQSLAKNKASYHHMRHFVEEHLASIKSNIIENTMRCNDASCFTTEKNFHKKELFDADFLQQMKRLRLDFMHDGIPPLVTHNLLNESNDDIIQNLTRSGLTNSPQTKVKVIFYPTYLSGIDGLIDLPYYEAIKGCHLGLFPSYYEPWGYTPLESAALGVPSLTTDLGGFGRFLLSQGKGKSGVYVLQRYHKSEEETVRSFTEILYHFTSLNRKGRVDEKLVAKQISDLADWKLFIQFYLEAHTKAIEKVY